ncbi:hypothetical protein FOA52_016214 [Chlamydomonas sp. UWO 241]|nr:hypothetical protein FOA52_016214 [Chlamydomonas sp. UWO 241]
MSRVVRPHNALANLILQRGMASAPDHLGLLHFLVHSLEGAPHPALALDAARRLYEGGPGLGHALHMRAHIDMRTGHYDRVLAASKAAVEADVRWNLARSGGGASTMLYEYSAHNIAFMAEAAQRMGSWRETCAALALLNTASGFLMATDPSAHAHLAQYLTRQLLQPLRFGLYAQVLKGTDPGGPGPVSISADGATTTISVQLPGQGNSSHSFPCARAVCGAARTFVRCVAHARQRHKLEAKQDLADLVGVACAEGAAGEQACTLPPDSAPAAAHALGLLYARQHSQLVIAAAGCSMGAAGGHDSTTSSPEGEDVKGSMSASLKCSQDAGADNGPARTGLFLLVAAAEVAVAQDELDHAILLLRIGVSLQNDLFYDEPAPLFYPLGETLAGRLMARRGARDVEEAAGVLRQVLFQWPGSALATLALAEAVSLTGGSTAQLGGASLAQALRRATRHNDTALDLAWL